MKLAVLDNSLMLGNWRVQWDKPVAELCSQMLEHLTNDNAARVLKASFTTTNAAARAAHTMVFMDTVKAYFSYYMYTECGIPYIDIQGGRKDWEHMAAVIGPLLTDLELGGWNDQLQKILQRFARAYNGRSQEDRAFWQGIFKYNQERGSGTQASVTGWLTLLFPYISGGINPAVRIPGSKVPMLAHQCSPDEDPLGEDPYVFDIPHRLSQWHHAGALQVGSQWHN